MIKAWMSMIKAETASQPRILFNPLTVENDQPIPTVVRLDVHLVSGSSSWLGLTRELFTG
jgi:hypothetical protein